MLNEDSEPDRSESALERRVAMGLDNDVHPPVTEEVDLADFIAGDGDDETDGT